jgi:hypothetical protein
MCKSEKIKDKRKSMRNELIENSPAQLDSKFSNGRLSGGFCWPQGQNTENSPAQRDSKLSNWGMGGMRRMGKKPVMKKHPVEPHSKNSKSRSTVKDSPAQPDSRISEWINCPLSPLCLFSPLAPKNLFAQPDSNISKFNKNQTPHSLHFHADYTLNFKLETVYSVLFIVISADVFLR